MPQFIRRHRFTSLLVLVCTLYILPLLVLTGDAEIFLKIDTIKGESKTNGFEEWIPVDSASFSVSRPVIEVEGKPSTPGTDASRSDIVLGRLLDSSSPLLFLEALAGTPKNSVKLHFTQSNGGLLSTYLKLTLDGVLISSINQSSNGERPTESLSVHYDKITYEYQSFDENGKAGTVTPMKYDFINQTTKF